MDPDWPRLRLTEDFPFRADGDYVNSIGYSYPELKTWSLFIRLRNQLHHSVLDPETGVESFVEAPIYEQAVKLTATKSYAHTDKQPVAWLVERMPKKKRGRPHFKITLIVNKDITVRVRKPKKIPGEFAEKAGNYVGVKKVDIHDVYIDKEIIRVQDISQIPPQNEVASFVSNFKLATHVYINRKGPVAYYLEGDSLLWDSEFAENYFHSDKPTDPDALLSGQLPSILRPSNRHAIVHPKPNGVEIVHSMGNWRISVENKSPGKPFALWYHVTRAYDQEKYWRQTERQIFLVQIAFVGDAKIEGDYWKIDYDGNFDFLGGRVPVQLEIGEVKGYTVETLPPPFNPLKRDSVVFGGDVAYDKLDSNYFSSRVEAAYTVVSMVPVVGTVADLAHLGYMAYTEKTFWGDDVEDGDLIWEAGFLVVGVIFDVKDAAKLLGVVADIFPGMERMIVKSNPGLEDDVVRAVWNALPHHTRSAVLNKRAAGNFSEEMFREIEKIATLKKALNDVQGKTPEAKKALEEANKILEAAGESRLSKAAINRIAEGKLLSMLTDVMGSGGSTIARSDEALDAAAIARLFDDFAPDKLPGFDQLDTATKAKVWEKFRLAQGDAHSILRQGGFTGDVALRHQELLDDILEGLTGDNLAGAHRMIRHARVNLVINLENGTFRNPILAKGYSQHLAYRIVDNVFAAVDEKPTTRARHMAEWMKKVSGGIYDAEIVKYFGSKRGSALTEVFEDVFTISDPEYVRGGLRKVFGNIDATTTRMGSKASAATPNSYRINKALTDGVGDQFPVDHCIEQRFLTHPLLGGRKQDGMVEVLENEEFVSLIVPRNAVLRRIAEAESKNMPEFADGVKFLYNHDDKTAIMAELIPVGEEWRYTFQDILDAHTICYKRLGVPDDQIRTLLNGNMGILAHYANQGLDQGSNLKDITRIKDSSSVPLLELEQRLQQAKHIAMQWEKID